MPSDAATAIAYAGALVGLIGGGVGLFNSWKAVCWKRAELANSYLRELNSNQELAFACRALDWQMGRLVVPESLRPLLTTSASYIEHDYDAFMNSLEPVLYYEEMKRDDRIQIYRTTMDSLLSWLSLVWSALDRKLFMAEDIDEVDYWVSKIKKEEIFCRFIEVFGYKESF